MSKGLRVKSYTWGLACLLCAAALAAGCRPAATTGAPLTPQEARRASAEGPSAGSPFLDAFVAAAVERTSHRVRYDPTYFQIDYPGGDVPEEVGVCTDEVIRSYRKVGVDLQKEVHEDMAANFDLYPKRWGLRRPDTNIDHRRVPNLMTFFSRKGEALPVTRDARDYRPGEIVTWDLGRGVPHIGIVVNVASPADPRRFQIVHNVGAGPKMEDVLFEWQITGHYRYEGPRPRPPR